MENRRLNIAFLHDWSVPLDEQWDYSDGIRSALGVIARTHKLTYYASGQPLTVLHDGYTITLVPAEEQLASLLANQHPDVIIAWGSLDRPWHRLIHERFQSTPKVLCFAGGPTAHIAKSYFRVIVCESQVYLDDFTKAGVTAVRGFGTNMQVFHPRRLPKVWDAIYPASLCFHKNLELFARAMREHGLCVGNHNEPTVASKILSFGTSLLHRVNSNTLSDLYSMSRCTVVTGGPHSGGQRVVLESMACGIPVIVMEDNDRCKEFVDESGFGKVCQPIAEDIRSAVREVIENPPDSSLGTGYVQSKYSESNYADSIMSAVHLAMKN